MALSNAKPTAAEVAWDILVIAKEQEKSLTVMQILKLVYISYGWWLVYNTEPLFDDSIQAWQYGPVVPDVYHTFKRFRRSPVPFSAIPSKRRIKNDEVQKLLETVVTGYGDLSGFQLSSITHARGTPWQKVYRPGELFIEIPAYLIKEHYEERAANLEKSGA